MSLLQSDSHPYPATIGLRIEPAPPGTGVEFRLGLDPRAVPLYIYKTLGNFTDAMTEYIVSTFRTGLYGWQVTDCAVTMFECAYYIGDGPKKRVLPTPRTTAADFRKLTPLVLTGALEQAGTIVCEPVTQLRVESPETRIGGVMSVLAGLGASVATPRPEDDVSIIEAQLPSARVHAFQQQLPRLTGGEGALDTSFAGYQPVHGSFPVRGFAG